MNLLKTRFPTILGLFLLVVGVVGTIFFFQGKRVTVSPELTPTKVRITNISDNKFSVSWITGTATQGSIEYGLLGEKLISKAWDERDTETNRGQYKTHHVTIDALQPSTEYAFRIVSGEAPKRFDNSGSPYGTSTGPVIGATPASQNLYGIVQLPSKATAEGAIAYLVLPGGAPASTLVKGAGSYAFTLSTMRTSDLREYNKNDPSATIASVTIESGELQSTSSISLANSAPVPTITLGQNMDFLNAPQAPAVAVVESEPVPSETPQALTILNVEPLTEENEVNAVTTETVSILNPSVEGEILTTLRPEFRGSGPVGKTLSLAITGQKAVSDTLTVAYDKTWSWAPLVDLKPGLQKITISYTTAGGTTEKIERGFSINISQVGLEPAFVATPSASTQASSAPSSSVQPRVAMPATDSGVPVTGVIENTLLTVAAGIVIMVVGAALMLL